MSNENGNELQDLFKLCDKYELEINQLKRRLTLLEKRGQKEIDRFYNSVARVNKKIATIKSKIWW